MDISDTIIPRSDQLNAEDLLAGPRTVTITGVEAGSSEQPVFIHLAEVEGRTFRPSKTVRRVLASAWGVEAAAWIGRSMTLYRDPDVKFGGEQVGGIRVSHLSHLDGPLTLALTTTRGKRARTVVQPLVVPVARDWAHEIASATTEDELRAIWAESDKGAAIADLIRRRKAEITPPADVDELPGADEGVAR